jgi:DNA-binding NarL/FixJ family response regulator
MALAGLRRFDEALVAAELSGYESRRLHDSSGAVNAYAMRIRVLLQAGEIAEACATEPPDVSGAQPSIAGESLCSRALALATIARVSEATSLAEEAIAGTRGLEAAALYDAVRAVCAIKLRSPDMIERCELLLRRALELGAPDLVVTAYRANPGLLSVLLVSTELRDRALFLVRRARDDELLASLGLSAASVVDPVMTLSPREREVYALVCEGLSNAEIGRKLFIAESTVKAHVHRLLGKLGVNSRTALLLNAAQRSYATPTDAARGSSRGVGDSTNEPNPGPRA